MPTPVIPLVDLQAQYQSIKAEIDDAVLEVLGSGRFVLGPAVEAFEDSFAAFCRVEHTAAVNSGTSALHLALLAAGIKPGDEVITVPMTFVATVAPILYVGATPVLVDVDPDTFNMDPAKIEAAITDRTKAIMPVHLHGLMADMDPIMEIAKAHGLVVIEDAAQAHGAEYKGRRAGSLGHMGCFSFYPGKNLGAYGEGGAVVTDDAALAAKVRMLRDWGLDSKRQHAVKGYNYRMDGIQGAILNVKMAYIEDWTEARRGHAGRYDSLLAGTGLPTPCEPPHSRHVYHIYALRLDDRDGAHRRLADAGIASGFHYALPVHLQPAYQDRGYKEGDFPVAEDLARRFLSLPMYPELSPDHVEACCAALKGAR